MNVLILPSWYPTKKHTLNGIFFKEQTEALNHYFEMQQINGKVMVLYIECFVLNNIRSYFKAHRWKYDTENGVDCLQAKILYLPKLHGLNLIRGGKLLKKLIKKIEKDYNIEFDIVHIHSALDAGLWYTYSNINIPYVITEHSTKYARNIIDSYRLKQLVNVFGKAKKSLAVGSGLANIIYENTKILPEVVFNIVKEPEADSNQYDQGKKFTFFSLGLGAYKKGFDILINAFAKYLNNGNTGQLVIAGLEENEIEELKNQIDTLQVPDVILYPKLEKQDVFQKMNFCDVFVLVSRVETFGIVCAEAMYCGRPVIASATGGPDSYINEQNGIIVPVEDVAATARAMEYLKNHYESYQTEQIRDFAIKHFSPEVITQEIYHIYEQVISDE